MYRPIHDYGVIGNLRSAVLISKDGSIDWACAPFIDSPSIFAALLDDEKGGFWQITPTEFESSEQEYISNTNVLVTRFITKTGTIELIDFLPLEREKTFVPAEQNTTFRIHRKIMCTEGAVVVQSRFAPRLDYAREETSLTALEGGLAVKGAYERVTGVLDAPGSFVVQDNIALHEMHLEKNDSQYLIFRYNVQEVPVREDATHHHDTELADVISFWQSWAQKCDIRDCITEGPYQAVALRSALILKILFFEPIGTIAAAATTSLPEEIGGVRNWDYRYNWLRDAAFVLQALFRAGHADEAEDYFTWLMDEVYANLKHADELQIMYGLRGNQTADEEILPHLTGYKNSKPVRIGNGAHTQTQHDIYGAVLDTAWQLHCIEKANVLSPSVWRGLRALANHVLTIWRTPDEGLWEVRGGRTHFVHSKVMCWVALDRAVKLAEIYDFEGDINAWRAARDEIKAEVYEHGWSESKQAFTQSYNTDNLDAAILLLPSLGFIEGTDPKMISTIAAIRNDLEVADGLLYRYKSADGLPGNEGVFLFASFWLIDSLITAGDTIEAERLFNTITAHANHVGLFSEELDPNTGEFLGNFPQAFTHIGLINSAYNLMQQNT